MGLAHVSLAMFSLFSFLLWFALKETTPMAVAVIVKSLVAALVCVQVASAADVCASANIAAATFNFPQSFNGNNENFDWLISPTAPSAATPAGDAACPQAVYVGQYTPGAGDPSSCIHTAPTITASTNGCQFNYQQTDGATSRTFVLTIDCDTTATTLQPPAAFLVKAGFGSSYTYTGTFKSAATCASNPGPGPGPNPGPTGGNDFAKEACSGGCAFLIVFFAGMTVYVVAAVVFNIVTGKRGREAAPHTDFWSEIPSLIKDGVMFLVRVITCRASAGAGYQQV